MMRDSIVTVNGNRVVKPFNWQDVEKVFAFMSQQMVRSSRVALSKKNALARCRRLLNNMTMTRSAGDAYAALSWMVAHSELVIISPEKKKIPVLEINIDSLGVELTHKHYFRIQDVEFSATDMDEEDAIWSHAIAGVRRRIQYSEKDEWVLPDVVSLFFGKLSKAGHKGTDEEEEAKLIERREKARQLAEFENSEKTRAKSKMIEEKIKEMRESGVSPTVPKLPGFDPNDDEETRMKKLRRLRAQERASIVPLSKIARKPNESWFIIDNTWLGLWKRFIAGDNKRPGPITNDRLLKQDGTPKPGLEPSRDYRALSEPLWNAFYEAYSGGPVIARNNGSIYS
jgi:DUSP domain